MVRLATPRRPLRPWHYTSDGIFVLRYPRTWPTVPDPTPVLRRLDVAGGGRPELPILFDLRRLDPTDPVRQLRRFLLDLPPLARRLPQRRAYLVRTRQQEDLVEMIQSGTAPLRSEACAFREWTAALDWLRRSN